MNVRSSCNGITRVVCKIEWAKHLIYSYLSNVRHHDINNIGIIITCLLLSNQYESNCTPWIQATIVGVPIYAEPNGTEKFKLIWNCFKH